MRVGTVCRGTQLRIGNFVVRRHAERRVQRTLVHVTVLDPMRVFGHTINTCSPCDDPAPNARDARDGRLHADSVLAAAATCCADDEKPHRELACRRACRLDHAVLCPSTVLEET